MHCRRAAAEVPARPAPATAPATTYGRAADLVLRIAALIPPPSTGLTRDDAAWSAFGALVDEAAQVLVEALGHEGLPALRALAGTRLGAEPVCSLLLERAARALTESARNG